MVKTNGTGELDAIDFHAANPGEWFRMVIIVEWLNSLKLEPLSLDHCSTWSPIERVDSGETTFRDIWTEVNSTDKCIGKAEQDI